MKAREICACTVMIFMAACGGSREGKDDVVFDGIELTSAQKARTLSNLFKEYRVVRLETNDSCLIGDRSPKYIKTDSVFYVKSKNEILEFDNEGKYLRKLSRQGDGPGEYAKIADFEIVPGKEGNEIWIADRKKIHRYDANTVGHIGTMKQSDYVTQIEYVNDTTLLLTTTGDKWLNVCDRNGRIRQRYFDADIPNGLNGISQYFHSDGFTGWHIENHNQAAVYDEKSDTFTTKNIFPDLTGVSDIQTNRDYYEKYGDMEFSSRLSEDFDRLVYVCANGKDVVWMVLKPTKEAEFYTFNGKACRRLDFPFMGESDANDIVDATDMRFLITPGSTSSDNGFIFIIDPELMKDADTESNPWLLDVESLAD